MTVRVSICIATYRRPSQLALLLQALNQLQFEAIAPPELDIIVVDNDAAGSARSVCEPLQATSSWPLHYALEPQRGISYARNRAIAQVAAETDFLAFIDDDEVPDPVWLEALLTAQSRHDADVVWGPVIPILNDPATPHWAIAGNFFQPRSFANGARLEFASTNNILIRAAIVREMGPAPFDRRFALTGGEDTHFFMRIHRAGHAIVWASEAIVRESVPASRTTVKWILQRGFRSWGSHSLCERELKPGWGVQPIRFAKGLGLIGMGVALLPTAIAGKPALVRSLLQIARGLGTLSGLVGYSFAEYGDRQGQP